MKVIFVNLLFILLAHSSFCVPNIPGGLQEQNPNDPEIIGHLNKILSKQNEQKTVSKIISVKTQVVAGTKYIVNFIKTDKANNEEICNVEYVIQLWISNEPSILHTSCTPNRNQRQLLSELKDIDASESDLIKQLGDTAANTFDELDPDNTKIVVVNIADAKKQLVNGIMYHLVLEIKSTSCEENSATNSKCLAEEIAPRKLCTVKLYRSFADNSPQNAKLVSSECSSVEDNLVGAPVNVAANNKYVKEVADFAMDHLNKMTNSLYIKGLVNIVKAKTQIVSGMIIDLTLETADTDCIKNTHNKDQQCKFQEEHQDDTICYVKVLDLKNHKTILSAQCDSPRRRSKRNPLGGERDLDVNDAAVQGLRDYISNELTQRANSLYTKIVVNVYNATKQLVSGSLIRATVEVADTNCLKSENKASSECKSSEQGRQICKITIWVQPWQDKREITQSECHSIQVNEVNSRRRRVAVALNVDENDKELSNFLEFVQREKRIYKHETELSKRFRIFRANMMKAATLQQYEQGTAIYGATKFADLTTEEFKKYLGYNYDPSHIPKKPMKMAVIPNITLPDSFDWREHNAVTPVKDQKTCGSCWAFSVTGNIEGQYAIQNSELLSFSEQELVDCDKYDNGCNGGLFDTAYHAIEDLGGLEREGDYPYHAVRETCHLNSTEIRVSISCGLNVSHNEEDMAKFLVANGPISIALNANAMQFYMGGVSHPLRFLCSPNNLDHGVLIVGYGVHKTRFTHKLLPYWLVKNSWGPRWGNEIIQYFTRPFLIGWLRTAGETSGVFKDTTWSTEVMGLVGLIKWLQRRFYK